jgi:hypothetical protein
MYTVDLVRKATGRVAHRIVGERAVAGEAARVFAAYKGDAGDRIEIRESIEETIGVLGAEDCKVQTRDVLRARAVREASGAWSRVEGSAPIKGVTDAAPTLPAPAMVNGAWPGAK